VAQAFQREVNQMPKTTFTVVPGDGKTVTIRFAQAPCSPVGLVESDGLRRLDGKVPAPVQEVLQEFFRTNEVLSVNILVRGWSIQLRRPNRRGRLESQLRRILEPIALSAPGS
jgi:hypothetical protein